MSQQDSPSHEGHSKAFENLVESPDDLVGLLAYALYKRSINERRRALLSAAPEHRDPQSHEVEVYRNQAEANLRAFAREAIESERAIILQDGLDPFASRIEQRLADHLRETRATIRVATGFWWPGVVIGVVAWIISIILTIVVVYSAPAWVKALVTHIAPA